MFSLKINKEVIEKYIEGISIDEGDQLKIKSVGLDGVTVEKEEVVTIKSIEHYNADLFILTFKEQIGRYAFSLNQILCFKSDFKDNI